MESNCKQNRSHNITNSLTTLSCM